MGRRKGEKRRERNMKKKMRGGKESWGRWGGEHCKLTNRISKWGVNEERTYKLLPEQGHIIHSTETYIFIHTALKIGHI